jgi:proteasome accessory factor A
MLPRVFGIETEFGCLVRNPACGRAENIVEAVKDHVFLQARLGLIDLHARDYSFEPAGCGGFLINGARLYVDEVGSHEEYATPECSSLRELVAHERAGQRILQRALEELGLAGVVSFHNNSVDHFAGHTFGCHENYLVALGDRFFREGLPFLLPFLVTRQIFAGAGRVGGHRIKRPDYGWAGLLRRDAGQLWLTDVYAVELDPTVTYQLSQRADHILHTVSPRVRFNRAIINPKRSMRTSFNDLRRLHLLFGEGNMSEYALALKVGTTCLVLDLVEQNAVGEEVCLRDPLATLRRVSRDPSLRWLVERADGSTISAVDLQRLYLRRAQRLLQGRDPDTDWILREWEDVLDGLERDPMELADRLDWVAKRRLLELYMAEEGVSWGADILVSLDLEYHNIDPSRGLYYALQDCGRMRRLVDDEQIELATRLAPQHTRARARSRAVAGLLARGVRTYVIDWDMVYVDRERRLVLQDPCNPYDQETTEFQREL